MSGPERILGEGKYVRLVNDTGWEYVTRIQSSGVVGVIGITPEENLVLVEQYRAPVKRRVIELPAGLVGDQDSERDESFLTAAKRELLEETGYTAEEMIFLAEWPTSSGLCAETIHLYHARKLRKVGAGGGDSTESITVHEAPMHAIGEWLLVQTRAGLLIDPKVYAGLYLLGCPVAASGLSL